MSLDHVTLYFIAAMVAALLGAMMVVVGWQEDSPALKWWGGGYLLGAASVALWAVGGAWLGPTLSLAVNAVGFIACGLVWNAARVFHGRTPNWPGLALGALIWTGAVAALDDGAESALMLIGAAIVSAYATLTAAELWSERRRAMQRRWPAVVVPALHGCALMLPILVGSFLRGYDPSFSGSIWVTIFAVELVLYAVGTVFVIFMLVSDRAVTAHRTAASIDPLTGLLNRRGFSEACARLIEREASAGRSACAMILDIDHFKSINDRFGHSAGDEVLKVFAASVQSNLRVNDLSGRIGGEEFAALLPCPLEEGAAVAERVREAFEASGIVIEDAALDTTVSIGIAGGPVGTELDVLLAAADTALYQAKRGGRNRVEAAAELPSPLNLSRSVAPAGSPREQPVIA